MHERFCTSEFCVTEFLIIINLSHPTQLMARPLKIELIKKHVLCNILSFSVQNC
jgi:hypothetical protein